MTVATPSASPQPTEMAVIRTVCYSSVFEYPLTLEELGRSLIEAKMDGPAIEDLYRSSPALQKVIEYRDGYFFLRGQGDLPEKRERRRLRTLEVLQSNRWILKLICALPYTRMVALSGSAAHLNLQDEGDLDLFVVTRGPRVWMVAVAILLLTKLVGKRNLICFNFLVSDQRLAMDRTDLFSANQILSLKPLIGGEMVAQFLEQNPFVHRLYPNLSGLETAPVDCSPGRPLTVLKTLKEALMVLGPSQFGEFLCRKLYRHHLLRSRDAWTSPEEVVLGKEVLKLHTHGHRARVYRDYLRILDQALREAENPAKAPLHNRRNGSAAKTSEGIPT